MTRRLHNRLDKLENNYQPDEPNLLKLLCARSLAKVYQGIDIGPPNLPEGWEDNPAVKRFLKNLEIVYGDKTE